MSTPEANWSFAQRLDWLLTSVPRTPGGAGRFSESDLVTALARVVPTDVRDDPTRVAGEWLEARRAGAATASDWTSQRFLAALEDLFCLPMQYFRNPSIAAATDARISFTRDTAARGLRVIGPCRALRSGLSAEQLHQLHGEVASRPFNVAVPSHEAAPSSVTFPGGAPRSRPHGC